MNVKRAILLLIVFTFAAALPLSAEEQLAPSAQAPTSETFQRLRRLKEENPAEFQRLIQERKSQIKSKVQEFRQNNPEKFEGFRRQVSENRIGRLKKMKQENPQAFERDMRGRAERFSRMRRENPERFQNFLEKHPQFKERETNGSLHQGGDRSALPPAGNHSQERKENFQNKKNGFAGDVIARQERRPKNASAESNSQFIPRPDLRTNPGPGLASRQERSSAERQTSGFERREAILENQKKIEPGQERARVVPGYKQFQSPGNSQVENQDVRPFQQGHKDVQGLSGGKSDSRPSQGFHPRRGGSGDGTRRRGR